MIAPKTLMNSVVIKNGVDDLLDEYKKIREMKGSFVFSLELLNNYHG